MDEKKSDITDITIVLPSLNPDDKMVNTVKGLLEYGFHDIIVVNDGSDGQHLEPFARVSEYSECTVLVHDRNYGKGHALKTAFRYCMEHRPESPGVITIDGDGQHHPKDIYACGQAMLEQKTKVVLGSRIFTGPEVPKKSRFGNQLTRNVFRLFCGIRITDTQTGLRAIPAAYLPSIASYRGERFEYETNMLLEMKTDGIPFIEVPIQTIYLEENASSHFHPVRDSIKIYGVILKFGLSSLVAALIDLGMFTLFSFLLGLYGVPDTYLIFIATVLARIVSSLCNYLINRKLVFRSGDRNAIIRYYILCCIQMLVSASLVSLVNHLFIADVGGKTIIKAIIDTLLFFISFRIQKEWVFRKPKN